MRIGIVTHKLMLNFGGILQNWALQKTLSDLGCSSVTIDNYSHYPKWKWVLNRLRHFLLARQFNVPYPKYSRMGLPSINAFIVSNIKMLRTKAKDLGSILEKNMIEGLVVGSDQVWRPKGLHESELDNMFLLFSNGWEGKRIAYAASFGSEDWEMTSKQTAKYREAVKTFDHVSVREKSGLTLAEKHLGIQPECVLDPTLLLKSEDYLPLIKKEPVPEKPFLMAYILDITEEKEAFVKKTAESLGLEVKFMSGHHNLKGDERVEEWLSGFARCTFAITDSFHGTVFSTIFHKPFVTIVNHERGTARYGIFREIGLGHRIVEIGDAKIELNEDWESVEALLQPKREESLSFLKKALS